MNNHAVAFRDWLYIATLAKKGLCSGCSVEQAKRMAQIQGKYLVDDGKLTEEQLELLKSTAVSDEALLNTSIDMLRLLPSQDITNILGAIAKNKYAFKNKKQTQKDCTSILKERHGKDNQT